MSFDNRNVSVSQLQESGVLLVEDGNHGEYRPLKHEFGNVGTAFIRAADLDDGEIKFEVAERINQVATSRIRKGIGKPGDVLISHKGTLGKVGFAKDDAPPFVCSPQTTFWRVLNEGELDRLYLFAYMRSPQFKRMFSTYGGETDMAPYVSLTSQRALEFCLPSIERQRAIGIIVSSLDAKITLNRKTNETLEAMARALFKSWFVDFDPVRAKAEGRATGLPDEISDLFPDSFEETELGEIPRGWEVQAISEVVDSIFDGPHATPAESDTGHVFLGIKNMSGTRIELDEIRLIHDDDWEAWTRRVEPQPNDIVFTYEAALGLFGLIPPKLKCCLGRRMALIRPLSENGSPHFWFHQFIADPFQRIITKRCIHGATVNRTPLTEFPGYPVLTPPLPLRNHFEGVVSGLWASIHASSEQSRTLVPLRDTLLPKLISGELRIPDAERLLEEAIV